MTPRPKAHAHDIAGRGHRGHAYQATHTASRKTILFNNARMKISGFMMT